MITNVVDDPRDHIRSFVLRKTRMSAGQRNAYETLYQQYCIPFTRENISWELFPSSCNKHILEIGFGMGDATISLAEKNPETAYLGVEVHTPGIGRVLSEIERLKLQNLRVIEHDVISVLANMIPKESLDGVHIFFPDPWPKVKHHKRRLISQELLGLIVPLLKEGGYVYAVTDWDDYATQILDIFNKEKMLENPFQAYAKPMEWRPKTNYEQKGLKKGHSIHEIYCVKDSNESMKENHEI